MPDRTRADVSEMMRAYLRIPSMINRAFAFLRKMLNMAEVWGYRPDGSNSCRHVPTYPEKGKAALSLMLGIRLQFAFAARISEIRLLEWGVLILIIVTSNGQKVRREKFPNL